VGRRLTVRAWRRRACLRAVLGREDEADAIEVVFQVDRFFDIGERELCIDLACYCELGTDVKDSIMINASQWMLVAHASERSQGQYLPGEREAWNSDFEERDAARADLPGDIRRDAQICIDGAIQAYIKSIDVSAALRLA
jgi:hypothetical protein